MIVKIRHSALPTTSAIVGVFFRAKVLVSDEILIHIGNGWSIVHANVRVGDENSNHTANG